MRYAGLLMTCAAAAQVPQNPSPMTDTTRAHRTVAKAELRGSRHKLTRGTLFLRAAPRPGRTIPLVIHFHMAPWLAEQSSPRAAVVAVDIGAGSAVYARPFSEAESFPMLLEEARAAAGVAAFAPLTLTAFSAGYGAVREILNVPGNFERVDRVVLMDSMHAGLPIEDAQLAAFLKFARAAAAGNKQMLVTHSEVFPGAYASTTQCADYLLEALALKRQAVLKWGPLGMQQLSRAGRGRFQLLGFAGNTGPDHMDHLHAMAAWLRAIS